MARQAPRTLTTSEIPSTSPTGRGGFGITIWARDLHRQGRKFCSHWGLPLIKRRLGGNYIKSPKSMAQTVQYAERNAGLDTSSFDPRYPDNCTILGLRKSTCSRSSQAGPAPNAIAPHRSIIRSTPGRRQMLRCCHKRGLGESEAKGRGRSPRIITCVSLASAKTLASSGRQALGYSQSGLSI